MTARVLLCALAVCAVATPALADDITDKKRRSTSRSTRSRSQLAAHRQSEPALREQIDGVTARIRTLEANVGDVSLQLSTLEQDLALHRERLAKLNKLFKLQSARLVVLKRQYEVAVQAPRRSASSRSTSAASRRRSSSCSARRRSTRCSTRSTTCPAIAREDKAIAHEVANAKLAMQLRAQADEARCASRSRAPRR